MVETWPQLLPEGHQPPDETLDLSRLLKVWHGEGSDSYAEASVIGTIAITLRTMGKAGSMDEAESAAKALWQRRDAAFIPRT